MATINVKDAAGATVAVAKVADTGQQAKTGSLPFTLASDDDLQGKLGSLTETAPGTDTASSGANGRLQRVAQRLTSLIALLPAALGQTTKAASLSVALASDDASLALQGAVTEAAPGTDTASSGLNGRLQRVAQRLTSLIALLPAALGQTTKAASLSVALASDDASLALQGSVTETAPATDTASSGLNGRLQRIAQRVTSLIALFPTSIGQKAKAASLSVALASDDALVTLVSAATTGTQSNVSSNAVDTTILASNANRKGAYVYNDSTQVLYLLAASGTSSATVFTQKLAAGDSFNILPGGYTGIIKGIWASANGSARVTEWS